MRRKIRNSTLIAGGVFLLLLLAGVVFLNWRDDWVAEKLASYITRNLLHERGYTLNLERAEGNVRGDFIFSGLSVRYRGGLREPFDLFRAERVEISFDPGSLLRGDFHGSLLAVTGGELRAFGMGGDDNWAYPGFDPQPGERSSVEFSLEQVLLQDCLLLTERGEGLDSLKLKAAEFSIYRNVVGTSLDVERIGLYRPGVPPVDLSGRFFLREGGNLTLAGVRVHLPETRVELRGYIELGRDPSLDLNLVASPLVFQECAAAFGAEVVTGSRLSGDIHLAGQIDSLSLDGLVSGDIYGFKLSDMSFSGLYRDATFDFSHIDGVLNDNRLAGAGSFHLPLDGQVFGYELEGEASGFNLATFVNGDLETDLSGHVLATNYGHGQHFTLDLREGSVDIYGFREALGELNLHEDLLLFKGLRVMDDGLDVTLEGEILPDSNYVDLRVAGSSMSSALFRHFSGDSCAEGELDFESRFVGDLGAPRFDLTGILGGTEYLGIELGGGRLSLSCDSLTRTPLHVHLEGERLRRSGLRFDSTWLDASVYGDSVEIEHVSLDSESGQVFATGRVYLGDVPVRVAMDKLWVRWLGAEWLNMESLRLSVADSLFRVDEARWRSEHGALDIRWDQSEAGDDRMVLRNLRLAQLAPWVPACFGADGILDAELRRLEGGAFALEVELREALLGGLPAGDLDLALCWRADSLLIDKLHWRLADHKKLALEGVLTGLPSSLGDLENLAYIRVEDLRCSLDLSAAAFPLERLESLCQDSRGLKGDLSGLFHIEESLAEPLITSDAYVDSFCLGPVNLDRVEWSQRLEADGLRLSHLALRRGNSRLDGWLVLPLELSLLRAPRLHEEAGMAGDLHLRGRGEDLLGQVFFLAEASGSLEGDLRLAGSPVRPEASGYLRLRDGSLRLSGWEEKLEDINADAVIVGDTLQILSLYAREGLKWSHEKLGEVAADGWLTWLGPFRYFVSMDCSNAAVGTLLFFTGTVSGHVELSTWTEGDVTPHPYVTGDLLVHEGTLSYEFQDPGTSSGQATVSPEVSYEIDVMAENNLMLVNKQANLELSGELKLVHTPRGQDISGEMNALRGYYTVFGNKFKLLDARLDFGSAADINPRIDIQVETHNRNDLITIQISNTFAEPHVNVLSDEGYSQEDALRILLGMPVSSEAGEFSAGTVVGGRVEAELFNRLERLVSGELAGLVDFELENRNLEGGGEFETRWQVGRYLPGGIYVSYNQGLSMDSDIEFGLEYRLYNRLYLKSEIINRGNQLGEDGQLNEYNIDITFRYEY